MSHQDINFEDASMPTPPPPPPYMTPPPPPKKRKGWKIFARILLGGSLLLNFAMCSMMFGTRMVAEDEFPRVTERLSWGDRDAPVKVAVLRLDGVILRQARGFLGGGQDPVTTLLREIQAVTMDPEVRGILLKVNSPGGGVTASDEIYEALQRFKASAPDRRIVVQVRDLAASGGYYIALSADAIVAQPTSMVGSVGVMLSAVNLHELGEKLGMQDVSITSSDNKALLAPLKPVTPEHEEILQGLVDDLYVRFRDLVLENRPFDAEFADANQLLDGRVFSGVEAHRLGLVDEVGYDAEARALVGSLFGNEEIAFYSVSGEMGFASLLGANTASPLSDLQARLPGQPQFLYLWRP